MKASDINWKSGSVIYWDMNAIDPNKSLTDQLPELKEDLAQIGFPREILIDIGWYPEFSKDVAFQVIVVRGADWDRPLMKERCSTVGALISAIDKAIDIAGHSLSTGRPRR